MLHEARVDTADGGSKRNRIPSGFKAEREVIALIEDPVSLRLDPGVGRNRVDILRLVLDLPSGYVDRKTGRKGPLEEGWQKKVETFAAQIPNLPWRESGPEIITSDLRSKRPTFPCNSHSTSRRFVFCVRLTFVGMTFFCGEYPQKRAKNEGPLRNTVTHDAFHLLFFTCVLRIPPP